MITAKEALELTNSYRSVTADLKTLETMIREAATGGFWSIRVPYEMVDSQGYSVKLKAVGLEEKLKSLGFNVIMRHEERQFVDVWIEINWRSE